MVDEDNLWLSLHELSQATSLTSAVIIEIVEQGIVDPVGESPNNWRFSIQTVPLAKRAFRLHRDLEVDWSGIALAISLIDELEQLREENRQLQRRLSRFKSM